MARKTKIHFVCRGNVHRSRLAEAYAKSLRFDNIDISSSGIYASKYPQHYLSSWDKLLGQQNNISNFFAGARTQTTNGLLGNSDLIVFMSKDVFYDAQKKYDLNREKCLVWGIKDRHDWPDKLPKAEKQKRMFRDVKRDVDNLFHHIKTGGWVDIVDDNNQPLNFRLPLAVANKKKTWHRGCHALISTPDGHVVVEKRSKNIIFSPSLVDVTLGGHVDPEETPEQAVMREIEEELGLRVETRNVQLLEVHKWNNYHPRYKCHSRIFLYTYHVPIAEVRPTFTLQQKEVADAKIISKKQLKRLLTLHKLKHIGRLNSTYAFYSRITQLAGL
jgi:isopentenyl-diphosphate Delta-isomerase